MTTATVEEILQQMHDLEAEIKTAETKRDDSIAFHQGKIDLAKRIYEMETNEPRQEIERLRYSLETYFKENPPKRGKSISFSGGTIGYRKQNPKFYFKGEEVTNDNPALVDFVKMYYAEYLKAKEYVDWSKFKNELTATDSGVFFTETGEILDGFTAEILPDKFKVTTNG